MTHSLFGALITEEISGRETKTTREISDTIDADILRAAQVKRGASPQIEVNRDQIAVLLGLDEEWKRPDEVYADKAPGQSHLKTGGALCEPIPPPIGQDERDFGVFILMFAFYLDLGVTKLSQNFIKCDCPGQGMQNLYHLAQRYGRIEIGIILSEESREGNFW